MALRRRATTGTRDSYDDDDEYEREDDDEEYDRRPSRKSADEKRSRSRYEDDDDDEEEEPPRRRRSRDDDEDDDEEERPRRRRSRDDDDDEESPRRRRSRDDDDDKDVDVGKGWGSFKRAREQSSDFAAEVRLTDEPAIYKFLEDEPFVVFGQHWLERKGKKSFVCRKSIRTNEGDCPICDILGDDPSPYTAFNVLLLAPGEEPVPMVLTARVRLSRQIESAHNDERNGPLSKDFYAISTSGTRQSTTYNLNPVKTRDLQEDWGIDPLSKEELRKYRDKALTSDKYPYRTSAKDMEEIALEFADRRR